MWSAALTHIALMHEEGRVVARVEVHGVGVLKQVGYRHVVALLLASSTSVPGWVWALVGVAIGLVIWGISADARESSKR